ncbi:MAG TPA: histidinol-phosphate transaminase [Bryobacteraceae bacterium]|jgi:histidinol-phosphate aminotransferase
MRPLIPDHVLKLPKRGVTPPATPGEIRLDRNEQPVPPSPKIQDAIRNAAAMAHRYPGSGSPALRAAIAKYNNVPAEQVVVGNGSDELIEFIARAFLSNGDEVIIPAPSFFYYATTTQSVGGVCVYPKRKPDFTLDLDAIFAAVTPRTKVLYIANPNNPTGTPVPRAELIDILNRADFLVVIDECYHEFLGETVVDLLPQYPHLMILRSFSKAFGLAGLRVGYSMASAEFSDYLMRVAQSFSVNRIAQAAAEAAIEDVAWARQKIQDVIAQRTLLATALKGLGYHVANSATNFLLVSAAPLNRTSKAVATHLRKSNIYVADFAGYSGLDPTWFRVTIGQPEENQALLRTLEQF